MDWESCVIAVDLELAWAHDGYVHSDAQLSLSSSDQKFANYLQDINESDTAPSIILTGMYRKPLKNNSVDGEAFLEKVPSFLDSVLKDVTTNKHLHQNEVTPR